MSRLIAILLVGTALISAKAGADLNKERLAEAGRFTFKGKTYHVLADNHALHNELRALLFQLQQEQPERRAHDDAHVSAGTAPDQAP